MQKERVEYIDVAKAIAMICVIIGHVMLYDLYGFKYSEEKSQLHRFIASFHLALFFFLSGLVSKTRLSKSEIPYDLYKRFRCLIVPALVFGLPYTYIIGKNFGDFFANGMKLGYWYMFVLMWFYIINYPFSLLPRDSKLEKLLYVLMFLFWIVVLRHLYIIPQSVNSLLCLNSVLVYLPYFFLGNIVKKYDLHKMLFNRKILFVSLTIWIVSPFLQEYLSCYQSFLMNGGGKIFLYLNNYINLMITFDKVVCVICLCKELTTINGHRYLALIGKNTLLIYLFHYYVIGCMEIPSVNEWYAQNGNLLIDILSSVIPVSIVLMSCFCLIFLLNRLPFLKKIIFFQ